MDALLVEADLHLFHARAAHTRHSRDQTIEYLMHSLGSLIKFLYEAESPSVQAEDVML